MSIFHVNSIRDHIENIYKDLIDLSDQVKAVILVYTGTKLSEQSNFKDFNIGQSLITNFHDPLGGVVKIFSDAI